LRFALTPALSPGERVPGRADEGISDAFMVTTRVSGNVEATHEPDRDCAPLGPVAAATLFEPDPKPSESPGSARRWRLVSDTAAVRNEFSRRELHRQERAGDRRRIEWILRAILIELCGL